jgi:hypothetical protein
LSEARASDGKWRYDTPPEALVPFSLSSSLLGSKIEAFAGGIPFAPLDLEPRNLQGRLRRLYLPMWLVDADVKATWQAEAGFDYQVVSHQDRYDAQGGGWSSRQVEEGRIRWEPRLGRLARKYENVVAPALEEDGRIKQALGRFDLGAIQPYQPEAIEKSFIRIPDRSPEDAWSAAKPAIQAAAAEECRQAAEANHIRQYAWQPEYENQNWSLLLLPLYATFYLDDERKPQPVLIHGQTGQISGSRRASMKRGQKAALSILVTAVVIFMISLILSLAGALLPVLLILGVIGLAISLVVGLGAIYPIAAVWWFNRNQV